VSAQRNRNEQQLTGNAPLHPFEKQQEKQQKSMK
jgi:hypothetical protein